MPRQNKSKTRARRRQSNGSARAESVNVLMDNGVWVAVAHMTDGKERRIPLGRCSEWKARSMAKNLFPAAETQEGERPAEKPKVDLRRVKHEVCEVSPPTAVDWLEKNIRNRDVRQSRVDRYARDMRSGNWMLSNDAIVFDVNGDLINGQHRLWAVVESGETVPMLVARGYPPEAHMSFDGGQLRNAADVMSLMGNTDTRLKQMVYGSIFAIATGKKSLFTPSIAVQMDAIYADDITWFAQKRNRLMGRASVAASIVLAHHMYPDEIDLFTDKVITGTNLEEGDPALIVRDYLTAMLKGGTGRGLDTPNVMMLKILRAAQLFIQGKHMTKLQRGEKGFDFFVSADRTTLLPDGIVLDPRGAV